MTHEFTGWPKIARLNREVICSEKLDGTNSQVKILEDGTLLIGSRTRWITPQDDHFGFAKWVMEHEQEIRTLGPGSHFGEWWGSGIQRGYGCAQGERHFSLFNVSRWNEERFNALEDERIAREQQKLAPFRRTVELAGQPATRAFEIARKPFVTPPTCCEVVPVLYVGPLDTRVVTNIVRDLSIDGSHAKEGFMRPEGIIVYHTAVGLPFKVTLDGDGHKYQGGIYPGSTRNE